MIMREDNKSKVLTVFPGLSAYPYIKAIKIVAKRRI
jgi:hypothetical protein